MHQLLTFTRSTFRVCSRAVSPAKLGDHKSWLGRLVGLSSRSALPAIPDDPSVVGLSLDAVHFRPKFKNRWSPASWTKLARKPRWKAKIRPSLFFCLAESTGDFCRIDVVNERRLEKSGKKCNGKSALAANDASTNTWRRRWIILWWWVLK